MDAQTQHQKNLIRASNAMDKALARLEYKKPKRYHNLLQMYFATLREAGAISTSGSIYS